MNGCTNLESVFARLLHGDSLSPEERTSVDRHLAECRACRRTVEDVAALHEALLRLPGRQVDPPPALAPRIAAHLSVPSIASVRRRRAALAGAAMAAGVLLTLSVQHVWQGDGGSPAVRSSVPGVLAAVPVAAVPSSPAAGPSVAPAADTSPARPASVRHHAAAKVQVVREVKIFLFHPEAKQVAVTGDFNNWDPRGVNLRHGGRPGLWEGELRLGPGAYSYNFIVDGDVLVADPSSSDQSPDGYGGTNSILLVKGAPPS